MRLISFSMTTEAFIRREKSVTRRLAWWDLKPGDLLQGCERVMGLKKGEKVKRLHVIRVKSVIREPLYAIHDWGPGECRREGFPDMSPGRFIAMFCDHNLVLPSTEVNRIEFEYVEEAPC